MSGVSTKDKNMLIRFKTESKRVKGLAFHPKRPWILASLHDGVIQLWDYRMEVLVEKYIDHQGPVRGVCFHPTQPLFVSGGDDKKISVWNYQTKRCLFSLTGHSDYIRTVQFHPSYPWIVSGSDDQSLRIWNWQSRKCIAILTGHNHYVMCAQFHPKEDLVLSASLDHTVRVWDIGGLTQKTVSIAGNNNSNEGDDFFGASDFNAKHILEGHSRGVNWASFHPTLNLIVSGADDREVKLWRMNNAKAWEVDSLRGHVNNVSCVVFHPKSQHIISNSEDMTIRVYDMSKQSAPVVLRRGNERYWSLATHPTLNLIAAGHDKGLLIFKLARERPPLDSNGQIIYYFKAPYVYQYNVKTKRETPIVGRRKTGQNRGRQTLSYNYSNRSQHCVLISDDSDGSFELFTVSKTQGVMDETPSLSGFGKCAVFVSSTRFAVLDKQRQVWLKSLKNEYKNKLKLGDLLVQAVFPGGIGRLLLRTNDHMVLYDVQALKVVKKLNIQHRYAIKYVVWSEKHKYVAMFSKMQIIVASNKLDELCSVSESTRIKSGQWDRTGVFIYSTSTHVKYILPNGDQGVIRTIEQPIYITAVKAGVVSYIDRETQCGSMTIDCSEFLLKLALMKRRNKHVLQLMQSNKLVSQSILAYLQEKGYPEVALHFVQDDRKKFSLALECGNIQIALDCAARLNEKDCWYKLGVEALRQGNHKVVEAAYQKTKNLERLSFLYLITGNMENLKKMLRIATVTEDVMGRYHNALYLGDVEERVRILREVGQDKLAYLTAHVHGLTALCEEIAEELGADNVPQNLPNPNECKLLLPPTPILQGSNWPLLDVGKGFFDRLDEEGDASDDDGDMKDEDFELDSDDAGELAEADDFQGWGAEFGIKTEEKAAADEDLGADEWDLGDLGVDVAVDDVEVDDESSAQGADFVPMPGQSASQRWSNNSALIADLTAAGSFEMAMHLLKRQCSIIDFEPLRKNMLDVHAASHAMLPLFPGTPPVFSGLQRPNDAEPTNTNPKTWLPMLPLKLSSCEEKLKTGLKFMTGSKFEQALECFLGIYYTLPFIVVKSTLQKDVLTLLQYCREYITAMRLELARREEKDASRQAELACYFTSCNLQPLHRILALRVAIKTSYGIKNHKLAAGFCRRLLELAVTHKSSPQIAKLVNRNQIRGVLQACQKDETDKVELNYDDSKNFELCCESFTPIYQGSQDIAHCPYCASAFLKKYADRVCSTCKVAQIGGSGTGLDNVANK